MPANLRSQSSLLAVQGANGQLLLENPAPGQLGTLSPTSYRGLGSFTLNLQLSKPITLSREKKITAILRADAINVLNRPIWGTPNLNIDSTSFGQITSSTGTRSVNLSARIRW
jgi:hypothetical protein